jgi:hypothetical protein
LIRFSEDKKILWSIFRKYTEQLYTWASSSSEAISFLASSSLDKLWKQNPDPSVYLSETPNENGKSPSPWATLNLASFLAPASPRHKPSAPFSAPLVPPSASFPKLDPVMVYSDVPENFLRLVLGSMDKDTLGAFIDFFYRRDTCVTCSTLLQLFGISRAVPVLEEFLQNNFSAVRRGLSPMDEGKFELRFSKVAKDLSAFVNSDLYSDVIFVVEENPGSEISEESSESSITSEASGTGSESPKPTGKPEMRKIEIPAHKVVLSQFAYFEGMFGAGLRESQQLRISIAEISPDVFLEVLTFVYAGAVKFSGDNCIEILRAADVFGLEDLKILAELFVGNHVDGDNAGDLLEISQIFNAPRLMRNCKSF